MPRLPSIAAAAAALSLAAPAAADARQAIVGSASYPCGPASRGHAGEIFMRGIRVTAESTTGAWGTSNVTGRRGRFRLDLSPGAYVVRFEQLKQGYSPRPVRVHLRPHELRRVDGEYDLGCL